MPFWTNKKKALQTEKCLKGCTRFSWPLAAAWMSESASFFSWHPLCSFSHSAERHSSMKAGLLALGSSFRPPLPIRSCLIVVVCSLRPRLQRRDRSWFTQDSLLSQRGTLYVEYSTIPNLSRRNFFLFRLTILWWWVWHELNKFCIHDKNHRICCDWRFRSQLVREIRSNFCLVKNCQQNVRVRWKIFLSWIKTWHLSSRFYVKCVNVYWIIVENK